MRARRRQVRPRCWTSWVLGKSGLGALGWRVTGRAAFLTLWRSRARQLWFTHPSHVPSICSTQMRTPGRGPPFSLPAVGSLAATCPSAGQGAPWQHLLGLLGKRLLAPEKEMREGLALSVMLGIWWPETRQPQGRQVPDGQNLEAGDAPCPQTAPLECVPFLGFLIM